MVIRIEGAFYRAKSLDNGFPHPEDRGLLRCDKVEWDRVKGRWMYNDDDDWMVDLEQKKVVAREIGWDLRREKM